MNKLHSRKIFRTIPSWNIGVPKTQNTDRMFRSVYGNGFRDIRPEYVFVIRMYSIASVIERIGRKHRYATVFEVIINLFHGIPVIVKFMIPDNKGIISDLCNAKSHGRTGF